MIWLGVFIAVEVLRGKLLSILLEESVLLELMSICILLPRVVLITLRELLMLSLRA